MAVLVQTGYGGSGAGEDPIDYVYTGTSNIAYNVKYYDGVPKIEWKLKLLTSGKLTIKASQPDIIDVFLVGGGGGSGYSDYLSVMGTGGAGGGYTTTKLDHDVKKNTEYTVTIGAGGAGGNSDAHTNGGTGGTTSAFGLTAAGGAGTLSQKNSNGGNGGSGGGTCWRNEYPYNSSPGKGQGSTTREFGESGATLYAGGGGAGAVGKSYDYYTKVGDGGSDGADGKYGEQSYDEKYENLGGAGGAGGGGKGGEPRDTSCNGKANTGGGAGGVNGYQSTSLITGHNGGSGIVVLRGRYTV